MAACFSVCSLVRDLIVVRWSGSVCSLDCHCISLFDGLPLYQSVRWSAGLILGQSVRWSAIVPVLSLIHI